VRLDGATLLLQWATGGLLCGWVTTRHRLVSLGYGWLLRIVYGLMGVGAVVLFAVDGERGAGAAVALAGSVGVAVGAAIPLWSSIARRGAGVSGGTAVRTRRRARVAAMLHEGPPDGATESAGAPGEHAAGREFDPRLDLIAAACGTVGLLGAAALVGGPYPLAVVRLLAGAFFLGAVSDAMLLGHWYLVQPGLQRDPIRELVVLAAIAWPVEVLAFLWPTGMVQVFTGAVDDGWDGLLGVIWVGWALTTIGRLAATWRALRERSYSAVMAATGLLYLAILTAFGTDLVARAVLTP
jgi:hypothetical protein